ncbi:protein seele-like isoform X1 [Bradysia coprophila]|uniref:protein seele-like isoform X1 n=2 Tax=Bradysia coprophila TaxID=38358 RepID=UPI00187D9EBD|nr:protein seele-like isoform X1 [Bradysia coprophila]
MKTTVILQLCILISIVCVVKCATRGGFDDALLSNLKCLACKGTIREMESEIKKIDPRKRVEVSGFRLDPSGKSKTKTVQYSKSETYLTELMESMCEDSNFSKVRKTIIQEIVTTQMLNNDGFLDFTPDGDLSQTLNHFCLEVLEDNEDEILKQFMDEVTPENIDDVVCSKIAKYCEESKNESQRSDL